MMDVRGSQRSIRSRAIFDDDRLAEQRAELVSDNAANRIAGAARTKHGNEGDWPRRIIIGKKRRTEQCRCVAARMRSSFFMRSSSLAMADPGQACERRSHMRLDHQSRVVKATLRAD
jgi:hypothetical protein